MKNKAKEYVENKFSSIQTFDQIELPTFLLEEMLNEFARLQNKELIEAFFKYLCNDANFIAEAFEDLEPEDINNIIENFFFELETNKK